MINKIINIIRRIKNKLIRIIKGKGSNGIKGKIIKRKRGYISFIRGDIFFQVKKNGARLIYSDYKDWKSIQTWKGRKDTFKDLWQKTRQKQIKNWKFLGINRNDKILEVGFRDGFNLKYLQDKKLNVEGIEVNPDSVEHAIELGCKAYEEDIQMKTHYKDETFDKISAIDVLEHCFLPENALKEMYRILKDNGRLLIEIPLEREFNRNILHGHSSLFFSEKKFDKLISSIGFSIVKKDTRNLKQCLFVLEKKLKI
ncbi:MAG: class I SAM-dependent methyltransferase [Candidatus Thorarchaeota archaeon]